MADWTKKTLDELDQIRASLRRFYSPRQIERWLWAERDIFGGRNANGLIADGRADEVRAEIDRLASGVYI